MSAFPRSRANWREPCGSVVSPATIRIPFYSISNNSMSETLPKFGLHELLCEQLRDLYDAESQYRQHLREVLNAVVSEDLAHLMNAISNDVDEGISRLAEACEMLDIPSGGVTCKAMEGLVREGKDSTSEWKDSATRDAAIIANAQRVVHYEIAGFGTATEFARCLKCPDVAALLKELLRRSIANDGRLTKIATGGWFAPGINQEAATATPPGSV